MTDTKRIYTTTKEVVVHTYREWSRDNTIRLGASIAYYGVIALLPLLVIMIIIALVIFTPEQLANNLADLLESLFPSDVRDTSFLREVNSQNIVENPDLVTSNSTFTGIVGIVSFIVTASLFMIALQDALNTVWHSRDKLHFSVKRYLISFLTMLVAAAMFTVTIASQAIIQIINRFLPDGSFVISGVLHLATIVVFLSALMVLFAVMNRFLVKVEIDVRSNIIASFITAILMYIGVYGISIYLGNFTDFSYYGALSGFFVILIAIYYFAQIYLVGAQFGKVIAYRRGNPHLLKILGTTDPRKVGFKSFSAKKRKSN